MGKPILCLDFDGVLHSYITPWKAADVIPDDPVPGAIEFLEQAVEHFEVHILSSRSHQPGGKCAMKNWLLENGLSDACFEQLQWPSEKPPALVTLDDRALTFTGQWPTIEALKSFKPWNKKSSGSEVDPALLEKVRRIPRSEYYDGYLAALVAVAQQERRAAGWVRQHLMERFLPEDK